MNAVPDVKRGLRAQLIHAARGSVVLRVFSLAATLAASVVLARALGPTEYGIYAFVFAIVTVLALPSQVGIPTLLVRETAKAQAHKQWNVLKGLWLWSSRTILITSIVIAIVAALVIVLWPAHISIELRWTLVAGLVLVPLIALGNARGAALRGLRLIIRGQLPESVIRPVLLMLFVGLAWRLHGAVPAYEAMAWHVLAATTAFAIGGAILWRSRPAYVAVATADYSPAGTWWRAALPLAMISGLQVVGNQSGIILLGFFRPDAEVGLYKVATSAATLALFGLQIANLVIEPHVARLHSIGQQNRLQRLASAGALAGAVLTLPVFLAFALAGRWLIGLIYGDAYADAYLPLVILCAGQMANALFGSVGLLLNMTGHERDAARWLTVSAVFNVLLGTALIPYFGMIGAAIAMVASLLIWNLAFWRIAIRKTGIDGSILPLLARTR